MLNAPLIEGLCGSDQKMNMLNAVNTSFVDRILAFSKPLGCYAASLSSVAIIFTAGSVLIAAHCQMKTGLINIGY